MAPRPLFRLLARTGPLRWFVSQQRLVHAFARHNGHADLIRERIDGVTGD